MDPEENDAGSDAGSDVGSDAGSEVGHDSDLDESYIVPATPATLLSYSGAEWLDGIPTRADLIAASADASAALAPLARGGPVRFMPVDVEDINEFDRGGPVYALRLYGAMPDGSKAEVTVVGIRPFFDVQVPDGTAPAAAEALLRGLLSSGDLKSSFERVTAFPDRGYRDRAACFVRVYSDNLQVRRQALDAVIAAAADPGSALHGYATKSDDRSAYYRKAARELGLPLSDWAELSNYEWVEGPTQNSPLCAHVFRVAAAGYRPLVDQFAPAADRAKAAAARAADPLLVRDRTLVLGWDIETHSGRGNGDVPAPEHAADQAFMICMTVHWKDDAAPLRRICIVDVAVAPDSRWLTVVCGTPLNVLRAFALCFRALAPDIMVGFNDSGYDWPFIVGKATQAGLLGWLVHTMTAAPRRTAPDDDAARRWSYREEQKIKISAEETFLSSFLRVPGCVPIDVRVCFKKLFPKSETPAAGSLKFYLEVSGLKGKADMPIGRMWQIYEAAKAAAAAKKTTAHDMHATAHDMRAVAHDMRAVAHYCIVDAERCQALLVRRAVISDYREVSTLAYVSLADSHYFAGGMKVCNLLGAYAWRRNVLMTMRPGERTAEGKYPGAYVFPPDKGVVPDPSRVAAFERAHGGPADLLAAAAAALAPDRPVTGLDFSSLYPSLIMAYNLSPDRYLATAAEADAWRAKGASIHDVEFPYGGSTVRGWFVRHNNDPRELGLYPSVLIDLFAKRAEVKTVLGVFGATREQIGVVNARAAADGIGAAAALSCVLADAERDLAEASARLAALDAGAAPSRGATVDEDRADATRRRKQAAAAAAELRRIAAAADPMAADPAVAIAAAIAAEKARADFDYVCANAKQGALKVYMNTFYGEAGNALSPLFLLPLAGGVTSAGKDNIQSVAEFVRARGFGLKYGDSVSADTPVIVQFASSLNIIVVRVDELAELASAPYGAYGDKEAADIGVSHCALNVWRDGGFTPIRRVIRHAHERPLVRVVTGGGLVDCTTDHSLLRPDATRVTPGELAVGEPLLHADDAALIAQLSAATDGERARTTDGERARFSGGYYANHQNHPVENAPAPYLLVAAPPLIYEFLRGYIGKALCHSHRLLDPYPPPGTVPARLRTIAGSKSMATVLCLLGRRLGWAATVAPCDCGGFSITFGAPAAIETRIVSIQELAAPSADTAQHPFVYDLETESGHFHVGPGDLVVHNTDSLYLTCPSEHFTECDTEYAMGRSTREEWMAAQVRVTMRVMNLTRDLVNGFLRERSGGSYLKMAYEEVLYPVVFTGKKKYFGIPHVSEVNFRPRELFVRGIDVVKQGQPGLAREIGYRIMWACVALDNRRAVLGIVTDTLRDAVVNGAQWNFEHFVKTDAYKPLKNNIPVQKFVARMRATHSALQAAGDPRAPLYTPPDAGERFSYVIATVGCTFDLHGRKAAPSKGERMAFARVARAPDSGVEVDVAYYMMQYVAGLCARFVNSEPEFAAAGAEALARGDEARADELSQKAAKKALEDFIRGLGGLDPATMRRRGVAYRRAYAAATATARADLEERLGPVAAATLQGDWINYEMLRPDTTAAAIDALWLAAGALAKTLAADPLYVSTLARRNGIGPDGADLAPAGGADAVSAGASASSNLYRVGAALGPLGPRQPAVRTVRAGASALDRLEAGVRDALAAIAPIAAEIATRYEFDLDRLVQQQRLKEHDAHPEIGPVNDTASVPAVPAVPTVSISDRENLQQLRTLWLRAVGLQLVRARAVEFTAHLGRLKMRRTGGAAPPRTARASAVAEAAAAFVPRGDIVI